MDMNARNVELVAEMAHKHFGKDFGRRFLYFLFWLPTERSGPIRVAGYQEGEISTGMEGVRALIRVSPHTLNAASEGNLFRLIGAFAGMRGNERDAGLLEDIQRLTEEQDGANALRDDHATLGLPEAGSDTDLIVVAWGGFHAFGASLHFLTEVRKAYPRAYLVSATCTCCNPLVRLWREKDVRDGDGTMDLGIMHTDCTGAYAMRAIIDRLLDDQRSLRG